MKINTKEKKYYNRRGFTLIELIVAIFIFSMITVAIVSVFASTVRSYSKARAMKTIKENAEFAMNSIGKDVRMGKIEGAHANGTRDDYFMVIRNRSQQKVCYRITSDYLGLEVKEDVGALVNTCPTANTGYSKIIDLSAVGMKFDTSSGFYSLATSPMPNPTQRGWVEINLNIIPASAGGEADVSMDTDIIHVQTTVSSRDYGWENVE